jgi:hypothetical protein
MPEIVKLEADCAGRTGLAHPMEERFKARHDALVRGKLIAI